MSLTDTAVGKAAPRGKPHKLADGGCMYLEVMPTGAKYWRLKYRHGGKEKRLALGVYDRVTLAAARNRREDARRLLADGVDPGAARKQAKQGEAEAVAVAADTFEAVGREWMERQQVAEVTTNKSCWILETFLFPEIGSRPIAEITPGELLEALRKVEESGRLETAKRAKIKAGQVFRYAVLKGKAASDPTAALRKALKAPKGRHHAAITDPSKMGELLRAIDGFTRQYVTLAALKLAPLVFVPPCELRQAEWVEFDLDGAIWRIPGERMKMKGAQLVPLCAQAAAILRELCPLTRVARFVFPGLRTASRPRQKTRSTPHCDGWATPATK
ncbi:MAG: integrase arm-type DNA-binding domain-containing protein [Rhodanobacter sp.]